jgi:carbamoyltransferase
MAIYTLGLAGAVGHDPAAALYRDGELVAAVEEERLIRRRHANGESAHLAARHCLQAAGIRGQDVNRVAIPFAPINLFNKARWHYAYRHWYAPDRAIDSVLNGNRRYRRYRHELGEFLDKLHIPSESVEIIPVQHQLAHAASAVFLDEQPGKTPLFCIDSKGEYSNLFFGYSEGGKITRIKEFYNPDSLSGMYAALTDYLGFEVLDGEFKVMGIAPFGDPEKYDLSSLARFGGRRFKVNNHLVGTVGIRRYKAKNKGHYFSKQLVELLGPRRVGNLTDDPYVHYAAAIQKLYEDLALEMIETFLGEHIAQTGRLAVAGTGSMNIRLNRRLAEMPGVDHLLVTPACADSGTAIGAAAYVARADGETLTPKANLFLGPQYTRRQCELACTGHREKPQFEVLESPHQRAAELLAAGEVIAWFRGRMEFGSRALGNRSILADASREDVAAKLNRQVKFRETWRPYSASVLAEDPTQRCVEFPELVDEYMCVSTPANDEFKRLFGAVVHVDGTVRAQRVTEARCPDFYALLSEFKQRSGHGVVVNTALNRPGEAMACTPEEALNVFMGTDLNYLILGDLLVTKRPESEAW